MLRLACRLCLELGIDDPEQWLASKPKRVINLWAAYWRLEPWGMPWHRHSVWMIKLDQVVDIMLRWASGGTSKYKTAKFEQWMPGDYAGESKRKRRRQTLAEQLKILARRYKR